MVNAQEWINKKYPINEKRQKVESLSINSLNKNWPFVFYGNNGKDGDWYYLDGNKELRGELDLKNFPNLERLCIRQKEINNIGLGENAKLTELVISGTLIKEIKMELLPSLIWLSISDANQLLFLDLSKNKQLLSILVEHCKLLERIDGLDKLKLLFSSVVKGNVKLDSFYYEQFCIPDKPIFNFGLPQKWQDFFNLHAEEINSKPKKAAWMIVAGSKSSEDIEKIWNNGWHDFTVNCSEDGRGVFSLKDDSESDESDDEVFEETLQTWENDEDNNNNIMTNLNNKKNEKKIILEWESSDLKDRTMRYEKFKVIAGIEKEELKFYSTFFIGDRRFKKREFYEFSSLGNFVQDSSEIIQGTSEGSYEFERIYPSLIIKELWEEKENSLGKINTLEEDLQKKQSDISKTNEELFAEKRKFNKLKEDFEALQLEKSKLEKEKKEISDKLNETKTNLQKKEGDFKEKEKELVISKSEINQLKERVDNLQKEKKNMEISWTSPEKTTQFNQEKTDLNNKLKQQRRDNQFLIESMENLRNKELKETIEGKLTDKKKELEQLKVRIVEKLGNNQGLLLENFLEKQEDFDIALFDDVSQTSRAFLRAKDKLQDAKEKLVTKIGSEEVEELCRMQTEIGKLETSQTQWLKMEERQKKEEQEQFETFIGAFPKTSGGNN